MKCVLAFCALVVATPGLEAQTAACDREGWREVIAAHAARYPLMTFEDTYKLLHQGVFGSEHAAPDLASTRAWLTDEIAALAPRPGTLEETVESIAPGGEVARVHLRPYLAAGGDVEALLVAFLATAGAVRGGGVDGFRCAAAVAPQVDAARWPASTWGVFVEDMVRQGLPALHHSTSFTASYAPAYRVVAGALAEELFRAPR